MARGAQPCDRGRACAGCLGQHLLDECGRTVGRVGEGDEHPIAALGHQHTAVAGAAVQRRADDRLKVGGRPRRGLDHGQVPAGLEVDAEASGPQLQPLARIALLLQDLLEQLPAESPFGLPGGPLLDHLERHDRRALLQRVAVKGVDRLLAEHRDRPQPLLAGADLHLLPGGLAAVRVEHIEAAGHRLHLRLIAPGPRLAGVADHPHGPLDQPCDLLCDPVRVGTGEGRVVELAMQRQRPLEQLVLVGERPVQAGVDDRHGPPGWPAR